MVDDAYLFIVCYDNKIKSLNHVNQIFHYAKLKNSEKQS